MTAASWALKAGGSERSCQQANISFLCESEEREDPWRKHTYHCLHSSPFLYIHESADEITVLGEW